MTTKREREFTAKKLVELILLLNDRQVGNTTLMRKGTDNYDRKFAIVAKTQDNAKDLTENKNALFFSLGNLNDLNKGYHLPIAIDHTALSALVSQAVDYILSSYSEEDLNERVDPVMKLAELYQERCHKIERLSTDYAFCPWWMFGKRIKLRNKIKEHIKFEDSEDSEISKLFRKQLPDFWGK